MTLALFQGTMATPSHYQDRPRTPLTWGWLWIFLLACLAFFPAQAHGKSLQKDRKHITLWGQPIQYQFLVENNSRHPFDGEAFTKEVNGERLYFVSLNPAFFAKEATLLFQQLKRDKSTPQERQKKLQRGLEVLKQVLPDGTNGDFPQVAATSKKALQDFKSTLENLAWRELYQACLRKAESAKQAKKLFIQRFTQIRLRTIEYHEVAHLLDMSGQPGPYSEAFTRQSELNAFYTELVYGNNPMDTLAQAFTGLIDELHQGRYVDYSLDKIAKLHAKRDLTSLIYDTTPASWQTVGRVLYTEAQESRPTRLAQADL